jgi:hypothetical protein
MYVLTNIARFWHGNLDTLRLSVPCECTVLTLVIFCLLDCHGCLSLLFTSSATTSCCWQGKFFLLYTKIPFEMIHYIMEGLPGVISREHGIFWFWSMQGNKAKNTVGTLGVHVSAPINVLSTSCNQPNIHSNSAFLYNSIQLRKWVI